MGEGRYRSRSARGEPASPRNPDPGLCGRCRHAARQQSARGSEFWRCRAADADPSLLRYPPLPVQHCPAFAEDAG